MPKIIFQPLMICNPSSKNAPTSLRPADLQSAASKIANPAGRLTVVQKGGPENKEVVQKGGPETRNAILQLIASNGNITSREIANTLNINRSAILKHLKKMQEDHIIRREGSQKSGKWVVIS